MVSHWSIEDVSAQMLMSSTMETFAHDPGGNKADALRKAMLGVKATQGMEHPFFWAPFELVGGGVKNDTTKAADMLAESNNTGPDGANAATSGASTEEPRIASVDPPGTQKITLRGTLGEFGSGASTDLATLLPGDEGTETALQLSLQERAEVQQRLKILGHDPRGTDGVFGHNSRSAISDWQMATKLPETGFFTDHQLDQLMKASDRQYQAWLADNPDGPLVRRATKAKAKTRKCTNLGLFRLCSVK